MATTIIVQHEVDPAIGITLEPAPRGIAGWTGKCTQCGWPIHRWVLEKAVEGAQRHVDQHEGFGFE